MTLPDNSFLDKGILLGYCFLLDPHHEVCRKYIHSGPEDYYTTQQIEEIVRKKKEQLIKSHRAEILDHVREIRRNYSGTLDQQDIEEIRSNIDEYSMDSWRYLRDFYDKLPSRNVYELTEKLRSIAAEIEKLADRRKSRLFEMLNQWIVVGTYEGVREELEPLRQRDEEDFWVILDAHDMASALEGTSHFATTNPADFDRDEIREAILKATDLDDIEIISVRRGVN